MAITNSTVTEMRNAGSPIIHLLVLARTASPVMEKTVQVSLLIAINLVIVPGRT